MSRWIRSVIVKQISTLGPPTSQFWTPNTLNKWWKQTHKIRYRHVTNSFRTISIRRPPCGATRLLEGSLQSCSLVSPSPSVSTVLQSCCPSPAICCTAGPGARITILPSNRKGGRILGPPQPSQPVQQYCNIFPAPQTTKMRPQASRNPKPLNPKI